MHTEKGTLQMLRSKLKQPTLHALFVVVAFKKNLETDDIKSLIKSGAKLKIIE